MKGDDRVNPIKKAIIGISLITSVMVVLPRCSQLIGQQSQDVPYEQEMNQHYQGIELDERLVNNQAG